MSHHQRINVVWDMETSDPDDFFTLLLLLGHPLVNLKGVTITPGTPAQVGVVKHALGWFHTEIPVGAHNLEHPKQCVSPWHYAAYGPIPPARDAEPGGALLARLCDASTTLVTGAPLKNLGAAMQIAGFHVGRLVVQGGFAGAGVVPPEKQLAKFQGRVTCPTFNLNGDPKSALACLSHPGIAVRRFVSKNVCHGVVYDAALHQRVTAYKAQSRSLALIWQGMEHYLTTHPGGKAFHDPLAACCAIDEAIGEWAEVELYREKGEWGARCKAGTNTFIIIDYSRERFVTELTRV